MLSAKWQPFSSDLNVLDHLSMECDSDDQANNIYQNFLCW